MIARILIILCVAVLLIGTGEGKPANKNGRSVLKLKLTQAEINRGVSIQISAKPNARKENGLAHFLPSLMKPRHRKLNRNDFIILRNGRRSSHPQKQKSVKPQSKFIKSLMPKKNSTEKALNLKPLRALGNNVLMPNVHMLRNKRSAPMKEMARDTAPQVEDLKNFNEDDDEQDDGDYYSEEETLNERRANAQRKGNQMIRLPEQTQQSKYMQSEDYRDYAFDTTDTDQFNEDDDLLRRYYGRHPAVRRAAYEDDSFSDLMHQAAAESDHDNRFVKRLHYGNEDRVLNDDVNDEIDEENDANDEYEDDEYENYDDY